MPSAILSTLLVLLLGASQGLATQQETPAATDPVLHRVAPEIPPGVEAFEHTRQARCEVDFRIAKDGRTKGVEVEGCVPCYEASSRVAAMQWRFEPGTKRYHATFGYRVDIRQTEPSQPVVQQGEQPEELVVSVSIPVLGLDLDLDTHITDDVPRLPLHQVHVRRHAAPSLSDMDTDAMRRLQIWYGLERLKCTTLVLVDEQGQVESWHPTKCSPMFHEAVDKVLPKWRWEPYIVDGEPTAFVFELSFVFDLVAEHN